MFINPSIPQPRANKTRWLLCAIGIAFIAIIGYYAFYASIIFVDEPATIHTLTVNNYTDITITGCRPLALGRGGISATGFRAKAPNGQYVTGVVTSSPFQGSTIRIDN